jgi:hypothetical protein
MMTQTLPPHTRRLTLTLALLVLAFTLLNVWPTPARRAHAQETDTPPQGEKKEEPTCVVYGRAVYAETNRPVRRARIMLLSTNDRRGEAGTLTDARGEFRIKDVRAGTYFIAIDSPGLISPVGFFTFDQLNANALGDVVKSDGFRKFFEVIEIDGKTDKEVTVRAHRGASISGRVTYEDGDPAIGMNVGITRRSDGKLSVFIFGLGRTIMAGLRTDDRGIYRIAGLPPGEYVVSVYEEASHGEGGRAGSGYGGADYLDSLFSQHLLTTYYPHATNAKDATSITVDAGDERNDVDISIPERDLRTVAGLVRGKRDGRLISGARVTISRKEQETTASAALNSYYARYAQNVTSTDEQGHWELKEIPEGLYTISVAPPEDYERGGGGYRSTNANGDSANVSVETVTVPRRPRVRYAPAQREVRVTGGDVTELTVELNEGARISGTVTIEGGNMESDYMSISAMPVTPNLDDWVDSGRQGGMVRDGVFEIEGLSAGKFFLRPNSYALGNGTIYLKSITWNGKDILHESLEVGEGGKIEGVRVVFSSEPAQLEVRAITPDRKPAQNINIFLVPADLSNWSFYTQQNLCSTGDKGTCKISAAPGEYIVVPMGMRSDFAGFEDEIRKRAPTAQRVSLRGGEVKTIEISWTEK